MKECVDTRKIPRLTKLNRASINSKDIKQNDIFFAIRGKKNDGNNFISESIRSGASIIVTDRPRIVTNNKKKYNKS